VEIRTYDQRKKTAVTGTCTENGGLGIPRWELRDYKRKLGQPRKKWMDIIR